MPDGKRGLLCSCHCHNFQARLPVLRHQARSPSHSFLYAVLKTLRKSLVFHMSIFLQVRTLSSQVRLDARTKLLNPKWYEGMMNSGYEGVREIQKRLTNTMGWSATSGQVTPQGICILISEKLVNEKSTRHILAYALTSFKDLR